MHVEAAGKGTARAGASQQATKRLLKPFTPLELTLWYTFTAALVGFAATYSTAQPTGTKGASMCTMSTPSEAATPMHWPTLSAVPAEQTSVAALAMVAPAPSHCMTPSE